MGKPNPGYQGSGFHTSPPHLSPWVLGAFPSLLGEFSTTSEKIFFVSEISADPQKRPYEVKGVSCRVKNGQKFLMKIDIKFNIS